MKNEVMFKSLKFRTITLAAGLVLTAGLMTGCSDKALVDKMFDTPVGSANYEAHLMVDVPVTAKDSAENTSITYGFDVTGAASGISDNKAVLSFEGSASSNVAGESDMSSITSYYETRDTDSIIYTYDSDLDEWDYESLNNDDISFVVTQEGIDSLKTATRDIWYKANKKGGSKDVNGTKCKVLELKPSTAELLTIIEAVANAGSKYYSYEDILDEIEGASSLEAEEFLNLCSFKISAYVAADSGCFMGLDVQCTKFNMSKYLRLNEYSYEDVSDDFGFDVKNLKLKTGLFTLRLSDVDNATVSVPQDAIDTYDLWESDEEDIDQDDFEDYEIDWDEIDWEEDDEEVEDTDTDEVDSNPTVVDDEDWEDADWDDEDDDEDWDDEEVDEDRSDVTTVDLYDEAGGILCTVNVPLSVGLAYYPDYSETTCLDFMDTSWEIDCLVACSIDESYASVDLEDFLTCESDPEEEYEGDASYTKEAFSIGKLGGTAYYVHGTGGEEGEENYIVVPYTDHEGETEYVTISFDDYGIEGWTKDNYISLATYIFG